MRVLISFVIIEGCQKTGCPDTQSTKGDLDDIAPQGLCTYDTVTFSPSVIDTSGDNTNTTPGNDAGASTDSGGDETISLLVSDSIGQPKALVNLDIYECLCGNNEQAVPNTEIKGVSGDIAIGTCVQISSTRIHCLTDYDGRASFALAFAKPVQGSICVDRSDNTPSNYSPLCITDKAVCGFNDACGTSDAGTARAGGAS